MIKRNNSMENIDQSKLTNDGKESKSNKNSTKVVIITSIDDDNEKILSYLNPSSIETFVVDLNETNLMNICQNHQQQTSISSVGFQLQKSLRNKN
jgi:hypothetical protein